VISSLYVKYHCEIIDIL
jgi:hypothetical protein